MANKYYAVRCGRETGIFTTWEDCQKQVIGYKNAKFKSFLKKEDALLYLSDSQDLGDVSRDDAAVAYVDGSFNVKTGEFSFGAVIFGNGTETEMSRAFSDAELSSMRNVAGEIKGAEAAMAYALEHGMDKLTIYHDYEGIAKWPLGLWKANKEGTIAYKDFYDKISKNVNIKFVKVKGHSGDKYNDVADRLAKEAVGLA